MASIPQDDHSRAEICDPIAPPPARFTAPAHKPQDCALRIAIVGGGIGGLCLALGLRKHSHIDVQIYEAAHAFSEIGAGIGVGFIFGKEIESVARQPEMKSELESIRWLGFALTEAVAFYTFIFGLIAFFLA